MNPAPKAITLAEIHSAYASKPFKKETPPEEQTKHYAKSGHFDRDPNHSGNAPEKPQTQPKRGGRR